MFAELCYSVYLWVWRCHVTSTSKYKNTHSRNFVGFYDLSGSLESQWTAHGILSGRKAFGWTKNSKSSYLERRSAIAKRWVRHLATFRDIGKKRAQRAKLASENWWRWSSWDYFQLVCWAVDVSTTLYGQLTANYPPRGSKSSMFCTLFHFRHLSTAEANLYLDLGRYVNALTGSKAVGPQTANVQKLASNSRVWE